MLSVNNLHASVEQKEILKGLSLEIKAGEVHAVMGPNGSGKSTLGNVLAGREGYQVEDGSITFAGVDLTKLDATERARKGVFLAFQYPVEIPGVSNMEFLKASTDAIREEKGLEPYSSVEFIRLAREKCQQVNLPVEFLKRGVNEGFSGGEKKRNELLQMLLLEPTLCILDETDSGLDIDALQIVADGVNAQRNSDRAFIVVTHYQRLLDYIVPDYVHVLADGKIIKSGGKELALELEQEGYRWIQQESSS